MADKNPSFVTAVTQEEFLARATAYQDQLRRQNPDQAATDLKLSTGWWKPIFEMTDVMQNSVPKEINDKVAIASQEFVLADYSRDALDKFTTEYRVLLAGHEEALRVFENIFWKNPGVWDKLREHTLAEKASGRSVAMLDACVLPVKTDGEPKDTK